MQSDDFYNVFTTSVLDDFRKIKEEKVDNLVYLISYVYFFENLKLLGNKRIA